MIRVMLAKTPFRYYPACTLTEIMGIITAIYASKPLGFEKMYIVPPS